MNNIRDYIFLYEMSYEDAISIIRKYDRTFPTRNITPNTIKKYRRKFAKKYHPDVGYKGDELKTLNTALDIILKGETPTVADFTYTRRYSSSDKYDKSRKDMYGKDPPTWAWAGYSGGIAPSSDISRNDFSDYNYVKKFAWEISGKKSNPNKTNEFAFHNFDGSYGRGLITVYAKDTPRILEKIANGIIIWDRFYNSRAVVIGNSKFGKKMLIMPVYNKKVGSKNQWTYISHRSFNLNPFNDKNFVDELKEYLEQRKLT